MKEMIINMICKAIETSDYRYIDEAFNIAGENNIEMVEDTEWISVGDDLVYIPEDTF